MTTQDTASAPASAVEDFLNRPLTPGQRVQHVLHKQPALSPAIVLVLSCVIFSLLTSKFYTLTNISFILQQVAVVGALAVGQTLIILTAGVDLSIGAVVVLSSVVMAKLALNSGVPGLIALLIGAAVALACQLLNGLLVTRVKLPPFIVTLGTLSIFTALTLHLRQGQHVHLELQLPAVDAGHRVVRQPADHRRRLPHAGAVRRLRLRAALHGMGATCVRSGR